MSDETVERSRVLEIRLHGRGGQGGVTCAKLIAALHSRLGRSVQSFGDYAGERSGAPIRAYTRVGDGAIENRNKVYRPDHLIVLDPTLLGPDALAGLADGGTLLVNTPEPAEVLAARFPRVRVAAVDASAIARRHGIGTRSVVIVNTTIAGAYVRAFGLPFEALEETYRAFGYSKNLAAAREAFEAVRESGPVDTSASPPSPPPPAPPKVIPLVEHSDGKSPGLKTGSWRSQTPRYARHLAPCSAACPAGNDVEGFVQALARDGERAAAAVLARTSPLPSVCGRVCPAPCMAGCNRKEKDGAVNVRGLERWIADHAPAVEVEIASCASPRRFAVVGGGPAGLAAAWALARAGHRVTIFEAERALGGVLRTGIPVYRLPRAPLDREIDRLLALGVEVRCGRRLERSDVAAIAREHDATILATGLACARSLDVAGAHLDGVEQGLAFLRRVNLESGARIGGHVVVLGGGNTALDCARSALRSGASEVTVVYRRSRGEMPAIVEEVEQAEHEGVRFAFLRAPVGFEGDGRVRAVSLAEVDLGPPDGSGRRRPVVSERRSALACDAVLLALGQSDDLSLLPDGWSLRQGRLYDGDDPLPAFAAGDLSTGEGTVAHAIGDGRRAALRALAALGPGAEEPRRDRADRVDAARLGRDASAREERNPLGVPPKTVRPEAIRADHFASSPPDGERLVEAAIRRREFGEVSRGLPSAREAQRCYACGDCTRCDTCLVYCPDGVIHRTETGYEIDLSYCKGCGICVTECPRSGMEMSA